MTVWVGPVEDPRRYALASDAVRPIAEGGQGFVYRSVRTADGRAVALKQLTTIALTEWPAHRQRLRLVESVSHPALGQHVDAFVGPVFFEGSPPHPDEFDIPYTVTEWVDGEDLTTAADHAELHDVIGWIRDVGHAAAALHRHRSHQAIGIVHRDIKPSNVRVTPTGAVLIDFGIARGATGATMTRGLGSPGWMPPETFERGGGIGPRSDTWQVAGLASWALLRTAPESGHAAHHRRDLERALRQHGVVRWRRAARHIAGAQARDPGDRPRDLERWCDQLVALTSADAQPGPVKLAKVAAVPLLALALLGTWILTDRSGSQDSTSPTTSPVPAVATTSSVAPASPEPSFPHPEDCRPYDPAQLTIRDLGSEGVELAVADGRLAILDNRQDAEQALRIARQYRRFCTIGAGNTRPNPSEFQVRY